MSKFQDNKVLLGSIFAIISACLWGVSGAAGQYMFTTVGITPEWVVSTRMICSGLLLLVYVQIRHQGIFIIWINKQDRKDVIIFAIVGVLFTQYTYFAAINYSNAATATVLQYLAPILIVIYMAIRMRQRPTIGETLAVFFALIGTFLLATHGSLQSLTISPKALIFGLLSAVALAFYTVFPRRLLETYNTILVIGWSMLIGGLTMNFVHPFWRIEGTWDGTGIFCLIFVIIFGTLIPYLLYLYGVKYIGPTKSSLFASVEPLSSTIVSVIWLHTKLEFLDYLGFIFIVATVFLLSIKPKYKDEEMPL